MKDWTADGRDVPSRVIGDADATTIKSDESTFVDALVDHMVGVDAFARHRASIGPILYIDATLDGGEIRRDHSFEDHPQQADRRDQPNVPWAALCRVGMDAVDLYCRRAFGKRFEQISARKQQGVLTLLESIKCVFEDGSDAGVFAAIAYQTMRAKRRPNSFSCGRNALRAS